MALLFDCFQLCLTAACQWEREREMYTGLQCFRVEKCRWKQFFFQVSFYFFFYFCFNHVQFSYVNSRFYSLTTFPKLAAFGDAGEGGNPADLWVMAVLLNFAHQMGQMYSESLGCLLERVCVGMWGELYTHSYEPASLFNVVPNHFTKKKFHCLRNKEITHPGTYRLVLSSSLYCSKAEILRREISVWCRNLYSLPSPTISHTHAHVHVMYHACGCGWPQKVVSSSGVQLLLVLAAGERRYTWVVHWMFNVIGNRSEMVYIGIMLIFSFIARRSECGMLILWILSVPRRSECGLHG